MINLLILILILLENSLVVAFPYNIIALPYLTYLAYNRGKSGVLEVILVCIIVSNYGSTFIEVGIIFMLVYMSSYFLSKGLGYERINIIYYTLIQFLIYGLYLYMKVPYFSFYQGVIMFLGYLLFNYIFIKKIKEKI